MKVVMINFGSLSDINPAMSLILSFTNKIGFFGVSITAFIFALIALDLGIGLFQKLIKVLVPGASFEQRQYDDAQDYIDFNNERDHAFDDTNVHDPEDNYMITSYSTVNDGRGE